MFRVTMYLFCPSDPVETSPLFANLCAPSNCFFPVQIFSVIQSYCNIFAISNSIKKTTPWRQKPEKNTRPGSSLEYLAKNGGILIAAAWADWWRATRSVHCSCYLAQDQKVPKQHLNCFKQTSHSKALIMQKYPFSTFELARSRRLLQFKFQSRPAKHYILLSWLNSHILRGCPKKIRHKVAEYNV